MGCGLIAQVMHLPHLVELDDRFELVALCDLSQEVVQACARRFHVDAASTRLEELLAERLDAVLVLTGGSHAPAAIAAAQAGLHVFVEKPLALSVPEGAAMVDAARRAGVRLMVGNMKRYDPAFDRLGSLLSEMTDIRLVRVTTLESPLQPYVDHHRLVRGGPLPEELVSRLRDAEDRSVTAALGAVDEQTRWCYRWILLDSLVHELNLLRGALGEPTRVESAGIDRQVVNVSLAFGDVPCHLSWVDLPGIARYAQEFSFYAPDRRVTMLFPSPFLRNMPTELIVEGGVPGTARSWRTREVVSYEEAFKRELVEFHESVTGGREPRTPGLDGLRDVALCAAITRAQLGRRPVDDPTDLGRIEASAPR